MARVKGHLPDALASRPVVLLTKRELERWRNGLVKQNMAPAGVNRVATGLRAALNLVADGNEGITNRGAWDTGLKAIPDATETRNVVLTDARVRKIVTAAYEESEQFGLLIEIAAETGARVSQLARLTVGNVKAGYLEIPTSRKGRGQKKIRSHQVPIPAPLATRLRAIGAGKDYSATLLTKPGGEPWKKSDQARPFRKAAMGAGLDPDEVTMYALRHSSVTRQLSKGVPIRVVAALHDTSVAMIEKTYSVNIDQHVDAVVRPVLLNLAPRSGRKTRNVVPLARAGA